MPLTAADPGWRTAALPPHAQFAGHKSTKRHPARPERPRYYRLLRHLGS